MTDISPIRGEPMRLPRVLLCHATRDWCHTWWTANTPRELTEMLADQRRHENNCPGPLVVASR